MMTAVHYKAVAPLTLLLSLAACAGTLVDAPSLNKRAFEISLAEMRAQAGGNKNNTDSIVIIERATPAAILPKLDQESRGFWQLHKEADNNFNVQSTIAQSAVRRASGSDFGSDNWSLAHVALSRLDQTRSQSLTSLTKIDGKIFALLENSLTDQSNSETLNALLQIQEYVESDVSTQTQFIVTLNNSLSKR